MADNNVSINDLNGLKNKFSINNFLSDLPRMLNDAFTKIVNCILNFYDPDEHSIGNRNNPLNKLDVTYIDATTVVAQNLRFKGDDGTVYDYKDIATILKQIQDKLATIQNISKSQIDSLNILPLQGWPLYADYYGTCPKPDSSMTEDDLGTVVLISEGIRIWEKFYDTEQEGDYMKWGVKPVADQSIYLCKADFCLYQYNNMSKFWTNIGKYSDYTNE